MKFVNRTFLVKLHMMIAAFILPVALMFAITGGLYTWGVKGAYITDVYRINLAQALQNDKDWLTDVVTQELVQREIDLPSGHAKLKKAGRDFYLEWTGAHLDVILERTKHPLVAQLKVKQTNWHRLFVQLHKAKGGQAFKVYAGILAVALLLLFVSGVWLAWQMVRYRPLLLSSMGAGIVFFVLMVNFS